MIDWLQPLPDGYPATYVAARLRGRRGTLRPVSAGRPEVTATIDPAFDAWKHLQQELRWLYRNLASPLRRSLAALFSYFEIRTLVLALRFRLVGASESLEGLLQTSLWRDPVKALLRQEPAERSLNRLPKLLAPDDPAWGALTDVRRDAGWRACEQTLYRLFFRRCQTAPLPAAGRDLLRRLIDQRNLLALAREAAWRTPSPELIVGGLLPPDQLRRALHMAPRTLARQLLGPDTVPPDATDVAGWERALRSHLSLQLHRQARRGDELDLILAYLWRCWQDSRNLGLAARRGELPEERFDRELSP